MIEIRTLSFTQVMAHHARLTPDKIAVVCGAERRTWEQLVCRTNAIANRLIASGLRRGDKVATLLNNSTGSLGNDARIAPGAKMDDGRFELVSVPRVGFFGACGMLYRLGTDSFDQVRAVTRMGGDTFIIERAKPGWIHTDGEPRSMGAKLEISLKPKSLRIMVPPKGTTV